VTTVPVERTRANAQRRTLVDRLLGVFPIVVVGLAVLVFYGVQAYSRKTPWVFSDELEWTQLSRSIAETGRAARRGQPIYFKSLYAYLIAPFWWIHSTAAAYSAIKYANAVVMSLTAVPTYLLARMLVSRRGAVIAALGSIAVPGMAYATSIVPDVLAYPYYALCSWLAVRALRSRRRLDVGVALVVVACGYFVRQTQFTSLVVAFLLAAGGLWLTGPRFRELRRNWSRGDTIGVIVLAVGALLLFNRVVLQHVHQWQFTSQYYKTRIVDLGLRAGASFTIGLSALVVIGGLSSLRLPDRRGEPVYRAYVAWTAAAIGSLAVYTGVKAAFLSTLFATLWEERNLVPLSPLLILGTVMVFESKRVDKRLVAAATAFVVVMFLFKAIQLGWPYYDAPGSALAAVLAQYRHWSTHDLRLALLASTAVAVLLIAYRRRRGVAALALVLALGWMVSTEIAATVGIDRLATTFANNLPKPLDWVDRATGRTPTAYVGQAIKDPDGENLTEFWNRSITKVESTDGSAPGPGPTPSANILRADGLLSNLEGARYVLADTGVNLNAPVVATNGAMTLYRAKGPWRLADYDQQVYPDTWCPDWCSYTYFEPGQTGVLKVSIGRLAYNGSAPAAAVTVVIGTVGIDERRQTPRFAAVQRDVHRVVPNGTSQTLAFPVARTPVRVEIHVADSTLIPPTSVDPRSLGVQVGFQFVPAKR
jgi:Dolichyl-phosphate-mannose-protein mannosyltransferase